MKYSFPAIFKKDAQNPDYINVTFPDLIGVVTFGEGKEDAMYMAKDLLSAMLDYDYVKQTTPTSLEQTKLNFPNEDIEMVEVEK